MEVSCNASAHCLNDRCRYSQLPTCVYMYIFSNQREKVVDIKEIPDDFYRGQRTYIYSSNKARFIVEPKREILEVIKYPSQNR